MVGPWRSYVIENKSVTKGFYGYQYPTEVNHWFSVAIQKECVMIRAEAGHRLEAR